MAGQSAGYRLTPASWPRVQRSRLEVAALDTAPGCLRLHAKHMLYEWGLPGLSDTTELLVSELVTNVVQVPEKVPTSSRPGPFPVCPCVELRLTIDDRALVIEVWDGHPAPPPPPSLPDDDAPGGRGLFLVQELSHRWGFYYPALPGSRDMRDFDRFRFPPGPVPLELRWLTGKVIWCELLRTAGIPAAL